MVRPLQLRVIGSRDIFQFFVPSKSTLFESLEFHLIHPWDSELPFSNQSREGLISIIVNPDEYGKEMARSVNGDVWLWFLKPLATTGKAIREVAPNLWEAERQAVERRRAFLAAAELNKSSIVIVPDEASFDYCHQQDLRVILSPPPVSDAATLLKSSDPVMLATWINKEPSSYTRLFVEGLPALVQRFEGDLMMKTNSTWPSHLIITHDSPGKSLPYEAAIFFRAGATLVTGPLWPRWGLEAGLDYLEYSTPEELRRIVHHLVRYPKSTQLMARRGAQKSVLFNATGVYQRILAQVGTGG